MDKYAKFFFLISTEWSLSIVHNALYKHDKLSTFCPLYFNLCWLHDAATWKLRFHLWIKIYSTTYVQVRMQPCMAFKFILQTGNGRGIFKVIKCKSVDGLSCIDTLSMVTVSDYLIENETFVFKYLLFYKMWETSLDKFNFLGNTFHLI